MHTAVVLGRPTVYSCRSVLLSIRTWFDLPSIMSLHLLVFFIRVLAGATLKCLLAYWVNPARCVCYICL